MIAAFTVADVGGGVFILKCRDFVELLTQPYGLRLARFQLLNSLLCQLLLCFASVFELS